MSKEKAARLLVRSQGGHSYEFQLEGDVISIGRAADCTLTLDDLYASRRHARIERRGDDHVLVDEGSRNGTFVGGERINWPHVLSRGDEISIGNSNLMYLEESLEAVGTAILKPLPQQTQTPPIRVDVRTWEVWVEGRSLKEKLSPLEFKLLAYLCSHPDAVSTRDELGAELWGEGAYTHEMLRQVVHRLKRRLEPDPANPRYITTVPGVGYRLKSSERDIDS